MSFEKMVDCHRQRLSRDLKARDLAWLCRHDVLLSNVHVIRRDHSAWIADHPRENEIPWPGLLTLGSHSRKHIFAEHAISSPLVLGQLRSFISKVKWRWVFRNAKELPPRPLLKKETRPCDAQVPHVLLAFCSHVMHVGRSLLSNAARKPCKALARHVRFALKWTRRNDLAVELSVKDGVFVLASREAVRSCIKEQLEKPFYSCLSTLSLESRFRILHAGIRSAAAALADMNPCWAKEVLQHLYGCTMQNLVCPLQCTIKTHKETVSARLIHSSTGSIFNALSAAVNCILDPWLRALPHICKLSDDAIAKLKVMRVPASAILLKLDVKDFYLSVSRSHRIGRFGLQRIQRQENSNLLAEKSVHNSRQPICAKLIR